MILSLCRRAWLAAPLGLLAGLAAGTALVVLLRPRPATAVDVDPGCTPARPCVAVVVDDIGRDPQALEALLSIPADLTFAVLPHARHSGSSRQAILAHGRELLLHLPMAPLDRGHLSDESVVVGRDGSPGEAARRCLEQVPEAVGLNNHMGSALTQDPVALAEVVGAIKARSGGRGEQSLFVLDSRTSERSVFCQVARSRGLACLERDFFLDDPPALPALTSAWARAVAVARERGWAIVVAHPLGTTVELLRGLLQQHQVRIVRLSRLAARPQAT